MGLSAEQVDGRVRLRWSGIESQPVIMSLQCISESMPAIEGPLNIPGSEIAIKAVVTSNKVGHDFPTGPLDIIQSWVEVNVADADGRVIYASGAVDDRHFIQPGAFMFKAEPVDQYGNLIDRHNLWEMVGVRYRRSLFPGFSDTAEYSFRCPGNAGDDRQASHKDRLFRLEAPSGGERNLTITARLLYRKIDQYLLNFLFGEKSGLTTTITEMAKAQVVLRVGGPPVAALAPGTAR